MLRLLWLMPQMPHHWLMLLCLFCWLLPFLPVLLVLLLLPLPARRLPEGSRLAA
jgi:hypothetical protein